MFGGNLHIKLNFKNPTVLRVAKAFWLAGIFLITYLMCASQDETSRSKVYYISELLNFETDTVAQFAFRWILWLQLPFISYYDILKQTCAPRFTIGFAVSWYFLVFSGIKFEVFDISAPTNFTYFHYVATCILQVFYSVFYIIIRWYRVAILVFALNIAYTVMYIVNEEGDTNIPNEVFIVSEYAMFATYVLTLYLRDIATYVDSIDTDTVDAFVSPAASSSVRFVSQTRTAPVPARADAYRSKHVEMQSTRERERR